MNELVTVLMAVYNTRESWLRRAIESILCQTYTDFEFLIVLDCPTDSSAEIVEEYARRDHRITVLYNSSNLGLTRSLNRGLEQAKGKYIARMDSDDVAFSNRLEKQAKYFELHQFDIIGAGVIKINENGEHISDPSANYNQTQINAVMHYLDCIPHPTWFVRTEAYKMLGGYRDVKSCEDYDLLLRAMHCGYKIGNCDEALLYYRINTAGITRTNRLRQFLTTKYLQDNYKSIEDITIEQIEKYLSKKLSPRNMKNFEKSIEELQQGFDCIKQKRLVSGAVLVMLSVFKSRYAVANLQRIILARKALNQHKEE